MAVNKKYVFEMPLTAGQLELLKARWAECLGTPPPLGSGMFATADFRAGTMRVMIVHPPEKDILRKALNQIALQTELVTIEGDL